MSKQKQFVTINNMAKIQKFVKQVDYLWYESEITDEQLVEWKKYQR